MCVMMICVGLHENLNTDISLKYTATGNKLENIIVNPHKENVPTRVSAET